MRTKAFLKNIEKYWNITVTIRAEIEKKGIPEKYWKILKNYSYNKSWDWEQGPSWKIQKNTKKNYIYIKSWDWEQGPSWKILKNTKKIKLQ